MIQRFQGVLDEPDCECLVQRIDALVAASAVRSERRRPATYLFNRDLDEDARAAVLHAWQACVDRISVPPTPGADALYVETLALTVLEPGDDIPWHADNCRLDSRGCWVPNDYPQRCLSAVLYLNEDFEGGEIVFDRQGQQIKPRTGLLIVFPSGREYPHQVNPVLSGRRYALGIWFTAHRWHALQSARVVVRRPD